MDGKTLARLGAVIFVAIAVTATAIEMIRKDETPANPVAPMVAPSAPDPLREGQRRCQRLGEAGARDAECLALWAESRDRFLGIKTQQITPAEPNPAEER